MPTGQHALAKLTEHPTTNTVSEYHGITSVPTEQGKSPLHGSSSVGFGLFSYQVLNKLRLYDSRGQNTGSLLSPYVVVLLST